MSALYHTIFMFIPSHFYIFHESDNNIFKEIKSFLLAFCFVYKILLSFLQKSNSKKVFFWIMYLELLFGWRGCSFIAFFDWIVCVIKRLLFDWRKCLWAMPTAVWMLIGGKREIFRFLRYFFEMALSWRKLIWDILLGRKSCFGSGKWKALKREKKSSKTRLENSSFERLRSSFWAFSSWSLNKILK